MRLTPNAVGLGLILVMAIAMLVWSPITSVPKAALSRTGEHASLRDLARENPGTALAIVRHRSKI